MVIEFIIELPDADESEVGEKFHKIFKGNEDYINNGVVINVRHDVGNRAATVVTGIQDCVEKEKTLSGLNKCFELTLDMMRNYRKE